MSCECCGNPHFAPHSVTCPKYTPDVHRVDGKPTPTRCDCSPMNRGGQHHESCATLAAVSGTDRVRIGCTRDPECAIAGGLCDDVRECGSAYPARARARTRLTGQSK